MMAFLSTRAGLGVASGDAVANSPSIELQAHPIESMRSPVEVCWYRAHNSDRLKEAPFNPINIAKTSLPAANGRFLKSGGRIKVAFGCYRLLWVKITLHASYERHTLLSDVSLARTNGFIPQLPLLKCIPVPGCWVYPVKAPRPESRLMTMIVPNLCASRKLGVSYPFPATPYPRSAMTRYASATPIGIMSSRRRSDQAEELSRKRAWNREHIKYPFWFGGSASCFAACVTHPLDLGKKYRTLSTVFFKWLTTN